MYRLSENDNVIVRVSDGANIPKSPKNRDYVKYLEWRAEGNEPLPIEKTPGEVQAEANNRIKAVTCNQDKLIRKILLSKREEVKQLAMNELARIDTKCSSISASVATIL